MKGRTVFFLKDSRIHDWLIEGFVKRNFPVKFLGMLIPPGLMAKSRIRRIFGLHFRYLRISALSLFSSKKGDIIICFLDVIGLYVFILSCILFKSREIVVINLMFNDRDDFITSLKRSLFRLMLINPRVHPTVTSVALSEIYRQTFNLPGKKFHLLNDCYGTQKVYESNPGETDYVFCGGINGRDWVTLVKAASLLPDIHFVVVGPKKDTLGDHIPANIEYLFNVQPHEFQLKMMNCSILALPLDTEAPAGLIVLFSAGLMHKPVISTNSYTMREYITSGENGYLVGMRDYEALADRIRELNDNNLLRKKFGEKLFEQVVKLGSPDAFIDRILEILRLIDQDGYTTNHTA